MLLMITVSALLGCLVVAGNAGSLRVLTQGDNLVVLMVAIGGSIASIVVLRRGLF